MPGSGVGSPVPVDHPVRMLAPGEGGGIVLRLHEPLSFWGGVAPESGVIIDQRHPQAGLCISGRVLLLPEARGSSSASSVLAECIRGGTSPSVILLGRADPILAVGSLVAGELYGIRMPVAVLPSKPASWPADGDQATLSRDGTLSVRSPSRPGL